MTHRIRYVIWTTLFSLLGVGWLLQTVQPVRAATLVVGTDCPTIQSCINLAAAGDTVFIPAGTYNESLTLNKAVFLRGANQATTFVQPAAGQRVLWVDGAAVTNAIFIANLTLRNGDVSGGNVCFPFPTHCGGGMLITGGARPRLINLTFTNNQAYYGGGLYADVGSILSLDNLTFRNNVSVLAGGGAYLLDRATITDSLFESNSSNNNVGGALRLSEDTTIDNTIFQGNETFCPTALSICHAGAVYGYEMNLTVSNSRFENNRCGGDNCNGGGLYMGSSFVTGTLTLVNTDFISNTAGRAGGGVFASSFRINTVVDRGRVERNQAILGAGGGMELYRVVLSGTQFLTNTAGATQTFDEGGGGLSVQNSTVVTNTWFSGNHSDRGGGGLAVFIGPIMLHNTTFFSNTAQENGGGLYAEVSGATLSDSRFEGNRTLQPEIINNDNVGNGGGLWLNGSSSFTDVELVGNVATNRGGGLFMGTNSNAALVMVRGRVENNQALGTELSADGGGGIYMTASPLTLNGVQVLGNEALASGGGGVLVYNTFTDTNSLFQENRALYGGGVHAFAAAFFDDTQFISNSAVNTGGGAFTNGPATFNEVLFQQNSSTDTSLGLGTGGGLRASAAITLTSSHFISNTAAGFSGGGVAVFATVFMTDTTFRGNQSGGNGGGLAGGFAPVTAINSAFLDNSAAVNGGALNLSGNVILTDTLIMLNDSGSNGGGLYTSGSVLMVDSEIISNTAGLDGGGMYVNSNTNFRRGRFAGNNSGARGGGIYTGSFLIFADTEFVDNMAGTHGGGAYSNFDVVLTRGHFQNNVALGVGGGVALRRILTISQTVFIDNAAALGGGVAVSGTLNGTTPGRMINTLLAGNQADGAGAALYFNSCGPSTCRPLEVLYTTIASPTQGLNQAVYLVQGTLRLTNTIVTNYAVGVENGGGTVLADYMLYFGNGVDEVGSVTGSNNLVGNPNFMNAAANDYRLAVGSAGMDNALDIGISADLLGMLRPTGTGFERGALETDLNTTALTLSSFYTSTTSSGLWLLFVSGTVSLALFLILACRRPICLVRIAP